MDDAPVWLHPCSKINRKASAAYGFLCIGGGNDIAYQLSIPPKRTSGFAGGIFAIKLRLRAKPGGLF
jgi:hypothetical protein